MNGRLPELCPGPRLTPAIFAALMAPHDNLVLGAEHCLFEFKIEVFPQVGAALSPAAFARASAKYFPETEEVAENIAQIGGVESLPRLPRPA